METSNQMFAALTRITSSIASTANQSFGRVLRFTGSFNDRTSLLLAAAPGPGPVPEQELTHPPSQLPGAPALVTTGVTSDIESATPETLSGGSGGQGEEPTDQEAESKRVAKSVQTVCLFAASASLVLFGNLPSKPGAALVSLYSVDLAFICLGLFTSLGLSMFSIVARSGSPDVARVQKRAMVMAVSFVLVSFTLRMYMMMLPAASLEPAWLVFVLLAGAVAVYLSLAWKFGGGPGAETASCSAAGAGAADRDS